MTYPCELGLLVGSISNYMVQLMARCGVRGLVYVGMDRKVRLPHILPVRLTVCLGLIYENSQYRDQKNLINI